MKPPRMFSPGPLLFALLVVAVGTAGAQSAPQVAAASHKDHEHHAAMEATAATDAILTEGVVKKIDKSAGKVTISHGPLPNGMPAMTMAFRLKETPWIDRMKAGQKIRFAASQIDGAMTLVRFEPAR